MVPDVARISMAMPRLSLNESFVGHSKTVSMPSNKSFIQNNISRRYTVDSNGTINQPHQTLMYQDVRKSLSNITEEDALELPLDMSHSLVGDMEEEEEEVNAIGDANNQNTELADNLKDANKDESESTKEEKKKLKRISTQYVFSSDSEIDDDEDFYSDFSNIDYNEIGIDSVNINQREKENNKTENDGKNEQKDTKEQYNTLPVYPISSNDTNTKSNYNTINADESNQAIYAYNQYSKRPNNKNALDTYIVSDNVEHNNSIGHSYSQNSNNSSGRVSVKHNYSINHSYSQNSNNSSGRISVKHNNSIGHSFSQNSNNDTNMLSTSLPNAPLVNRINSHGSSRSNNSYHSNSSMDRPYYNGSSIQKVNSVPNYNSYNNNNKNNNYNNNNNQFNNNGYNNNNNNGYNNNYNNNNNNNGYNNNYNNNNGYNNNYNNNNNGYNNNNYNNNNNGFNNNYNNNNNGYNNNYNNNNNGYNNNYNNNNNGYNNYNNNNNGYNNNYNNNNGYNNNYNNNMNDRNEIKSVLTFSGFKTQGRFNNNNNNNNNNGIYQHPSNDANYAMPMPSDVRKINTIANPTYSYNNYNNNNGNNNYNNEPFYDPNTSSILNSPTISSNNNFVNINNSNSINSNNSFNSSDNSISSPNQGYSMPGYIMPSPTRIDTQGYPMPSHQNTINSGYNQNPDVSIYDTSEPPDMADISRFDINPEGPSNGIKIPMPTPVINYNEVSVPSYTSSPLIIEAQQRNYQIWQNYQLIQNNGIPVSSDITLSLLRLMTKNLSIARQNSSTITEKMLNQRKESQIAQEMSKPFTSKLSEELEIYDDERMEEVADNEGVTEFIVNQVPTVVEESEEKLDDKVVTPTTINKKLSLTKDERKALYIDGLVKELYDTECSYIDNLSVMLDVIQSRLLEKEIIPAKAVEVIFFGLPEIRDFSIKLKDSIGEAANVEDNKVLAISDVFLKHVGDFNCYVNFISNYSKSCITIKSYEKSSNHFAEFLSSIPKMDECKRQDLNSFFIMPIQHAMRYSLLLSELNKKNPENEELEAAMNFMKEMAKTLNQVKRQEEEINGVYNIFNETLYCPRILIKNSETVPKRLIETYHATIFKRTSASIHVMNDSVLITKNRKGVVKYKYKFQFYIEYSSIVVRKSNKSESNLAFFVKNNNPNNFVTKYNKLLPKTSQRITNLQLKKSDEKEVMVCVVKLDNGKDADELLNLIKELSEKYLSDEEKKELEENNSGNDFFNESSSMFDNSMDTSTMDVSTILNSSVIQSVNRTRSLDRGLRKNSNDRSFDQKRSINAGESYDEKDHSNDNN